jgi:hypothetical protein
LHPVMTSELRTGRMFLRETKAVGNAKENVWTLRCVIPVVCRLNQTITYMHISSNINIYEVVCCLLYVKHNYMFRPQMLAIFRLYNENFSVSYTCVCWGCIGCREGCKCEILQVWGGGGPWIWVG